ncbi:MULTISPECIES: hypothetical protein [Streptomyces]|uniref:Uncharacterized protein n=1 Tax=Streptomyces chartreusis NRRL 3882 TaxID=1079985 RepID=A0A2N9B2D7_STRCX|nr:MULTISPECIES: hypothetical protein [Streptomyces]MYS93142.1 hypothetical protein [Streptomyces sp. SID5464]SOR77500.1 hypothetical protein SCNRRL3882_0972 [Streptomyces chartreusis NRRL 3882]
MAYHDTYHRTAGTFLSPVLGWVLALTGAVVLPLTAATAAGPDSEQWRDQSPGLYTVRIAQDTTEKPGTSTISVPAPAPSPLPAPAPPQGNGSP